MSDQQAVFVTGGASGIGRAIIDALLLAGHRAIVADQDRTNLDRCREALNANADRVRFEPLDVSDESAVIRSIAACEDEFGPIAGVVNSAGMGRDVPSLDTGADLFRRILEVNLIGSFLVAREVAKATKTADVVIANDFGHGLISPRIISVLCDNAPFLAVNAQTNAGNQGFNLITKYTEADYICLDAPEARLAVADKHSDIIDMVENKLARCINTDNIIITNGPHGCIVFERNNGPAVRIPAFTNTVVDTVGAGDAFLAVTAPLVCAGGHMDQIGLIGNAAGAIKVGIVGHRQYVDKVPMVKFLTALMK